MDEKGLTLAEKGLTLDEKGIALDEKGLTLDEKGLVLGEKGLTLGEEPFTCSRNVFFTRKMPLQKLSCAVWIVDKSYQKKIMNARLLFFISFINYEHQPNTPRSL